MQRPRAGYYQVTRYVAATSGRKPISEKDDDATEMPRWSATLRTGERGFMVQGLGFMVQGVWSRV